MTCINTEVLFYIFLAVFLILLVDRITVEWQKKKGTRKDIQGMKHNVYLMLKQLSRYE